MSILFYILSAIFCLYGLNASITASTVMQEIIGGISFMISAIFIVGGSVNESLARLQRGQLK